MPTRRGSNIWLLAELARVTGETTDYAAFGLRIRSSIADGRLAALPASPCVRLPADSLETLGRRPQTLEKACGEGDEYLMPAARLGAGPTAVRAVYVLEPHHRAEVEIRQTSWARAHRAFELLLNQLRLFRAIAELTGSEKEIRLFRGRCCKRLPNDAPIDNWHDDGIPEMLYGLSINLSPKPVEGGAFHLRRKKTGEILRTVPSGRFGDAHLFRIHRSLEHKVSLVQGTEPRCTYAGWFRGGADHPHYREVIRKVLVRAPL